MYTKNIRTIVDGLEGNGAPCASTLASVTLSARTLLEVAESVQAVATARHSDSTSKELPPADLKWSSSSAAVAVTSSGLATAKAVGTARVLGELQGHSGGIDFTVVAVLPTTTIGGTVFTRSGGVRPISVSV